MKIETLLQSVLTGLETTYALVNSTGHIIDHTVQFSKWVFAQKSDLVGLNLLEVLPEFIGQENELDLVHRQDKPLLRLEHINRSDEERNIWYLTVTIISTRQHINADLMVLVTNVTTQGHYLQKLTQKRNELSLARRRLAKLSYQLDYLVRHYLSPEITDAFLKGEFELELGGELREVSVLFADVRDFTPVSERLAPERLVQLLNNHLALAVDAIENYDGTITQFQGDNLLAVFNLVGDQPDHAMNAVQAGIALQQKIAEYHHQQSDEEIQLCFGVGINTGVALIGNIGARQRFSYTVTGNVPNLAARITAATPPNQVWFSQTTKDILSENIAIEILPQMKFKGKSEAIQLFRAMYY